MFAVGGMMLFPASNDLLTMFVALEVLSLPLYLLCGLARRRRLLSQEAALKYFLLGAFSSGFFLYGVALVYGYAGSMQLRGINEAVRNDTGNQALLLDRHRHARGRPALQGRRRAVPGLDARRLPGRAHRGHRVHGGRAPRSRRSARSLRLFYVAFGADRWSWQPMLWVVAILTMLRRRGPGGRADRHEADAGLLLGRAHRLPAHRRARRPERRPSSRDGQVTSLQAVLFYLTTYGFATVGAFAVVTLVRDAGGEATASRGGPGSASGSPLVAGVFAFFLLVDGRHPADRRLRRQVGGLHGRAVGRRLAGRAGRRSSAASSRCSSTSGCILLMFFTDPVRAGEASAAVATRSTASPSRRC